jgi:D-lactate dehydrogenase (cytochrome)
VILVDPEDEDEMRRAEEMNHRMVQRALDVDGTCTGEHGIGSRKMSFLARELPEGVEVMRSIKRALDPGNIMNPGKVVRAVSTLRSDFRG